MTSTCCWKYYLLGLIFQCQCSSSESYTQKRENIYIVFIWNTTHLHWLWKVGHLPLCSLNFLPVWKRSGTITIANWCTTTTASSTPSAIFNTCAINTSSNTYTTTSITDSTRTAVFYPQFGIRGCISRGLWSGWMTPLEVEEISRRKKTENCSITQMDIEKRFGDSVFPGSNFAKIWNGLTSNLICSQEMS